MPFPLRAKIQGKLASSLQHLLVWWVEFLVFIQASQIQFLVRELRSHFTPTPCCFAEITPTLFRCSHRREATGRPVVGPLGSQEKTGKCETWKSAQLVRSM